MKVPILAIALLAAALLVAGCSAESSTELLSPSPTTTADQARPTDATPPEATTTPVAATVPDIALFDVAGDNDLVTDFADRAPAPDGAQPVYVVRSYADPEAFDELLAQAESVRRSDQIIVTVDLSGCILLTLWALPQPNGVLVGYEFDPAVDCAEAINYRALFIIDETGTNAEGAWDYRNGAPNVTLQSQPPS